MTGGDFCDSKHRLSAARRTIFEFGNGPKSLFDIACLAFDTSARRDKPPKFAHAIFLNLSLCSTLSMSLAWLAMKKATQQIRPISNQLRLRPKKVQRRSLQPSRSSQDEAHPQSLRPSKQ